MPSGSTEVESGQSQGFPRERSMEAAADGVAMKPARM